MFFHLLYLIFLFYDVLFFHYSEWNYLPLLNAHYWMKAYLLVNWNSLPLFIIVI